MVRTYRITRACVGALFLFIVACEPPSATTSEELDDEITLTAEQPVAAFEVRLCVTEDSPAEFEGDGRFEGNARINEGSAELTLENLDVDPDYQPAEGSSPQRQVADVSDAAVSFDVILTTNLNGLDAGQCSDPQVVQFSVGELAEGQTVTITAVEGSFGGEWTNSLCPSDFSDASLSLEIERI